MMQMQKAVAGRTETHRELARVNQAVPIIAIYTEYVKFRSLQIHRFHVKTKKQTCVEHNNTTFSRGRKQSPTLKLTRSQARCATSLSLRCHATRGPVHPRMHHHNTRIPKDPKVAPMALLFCLLESLKPWTVSLMCQPASSILYIIIETYTSIYRTITSI